MSQKINYEAITKKALLSVVRDVLQIVAVDGLYKKQHLYITFSLNHPNTVVSTFLREDFDDDMTIVIQYEFWDLKIDNYGFAISLAFEHADETLYIPFSSIITFHDPSEDFCLEFIPNFSDMREKPIAVDKKSNVIPLDIFRKGK